LLSAQVSPVAICLVRCVENTHIFLVQHSRLGSIVYTCVAGFAEPGETIAQAARREVAEEIGLDVTDVHASPHMQSWPFPTSSLMCAYTAVADRKQEVGRFLLF
jgi:NAD+ diphosphatase